ncbi:phytoene/squalene synthase family protein [Fimbriimonas ginsengisoli]|uniref:Phytoene synthase n=1 Tax=Fimbriimonas ginsengisoli Gsoil 348 TaxID=661478 RepID=A0A068NSB9_FIMGI|nr:phytoene/squalene synthase family protein [Fimbriimonas ginsengisoli]AIE84499.1 phytoene synthase [Fimbriimonas ginsengisoli Gsoil 348]
MHVGSSMESEPVETRPPSRFASPNDHAECRRLHRKFGTTYYFATRLFGRRTRERVNALYGFVRVPDEWVDNPVGGDIERRNRLEAYRSELIRALDGVCPTQPVLRAFCDVMHEVGMPLDEPLRFLDAMAQDLSISRYETYEDLRDYMRGSASAVGLMMCSVLEAGNNPAMLEAAVALGEAMQLTNFIRDVSEDYNRGRIYLPAEDMARFGVTEADLEPTPRFRELIRFEIERARNLYSQADVGIPLLPPRARKAVRLARILYSRILDRVEANGYDVFSARARTSKLEKLSVLIVEILR